MSKDKSNPPRKSSDKPIFVHPMTPEEALQQMFSTPLPRDEMFCPNCQQPISGPALIGEEGERRCPKCGTIATDAN